MWPGGDVYVAVPHKEGGFLFGAQLLHQAVDAGGVGLHRHPGPVAPDGGKGAGGKVVVDDAAAEGVGLVGKDGGLDPAFLQCRQQLGMPG